MNMQEKDHVKELTDWIEVKLKFIDAIIQQARMSSNYGKEIQYAGMREAYQEFLQKLRVEQHKEQAA